MLHCDPKTGAIRDKQVCYKVIITHNIIKNGQCSRNMNIFAWIQLIRLYMLRLSLDSTYPTLLINYTFCTRCFVVVLYYTPGCRGDITRNAE